MKILVDTNILISAVLFPRSKPAKALVYTAENHEMVLCDQNLTELSYDLIPAVPHAQKLIRDAKDQPILNAAILYVIFLYFQPLLTSIKARYNQINSSKVH